MNQISRSNLFHSRRTPATAFTLLEVLVVLALLALLAGLQLTGWAETRNRTRVAQCASNLRQFTLAMHLYGNANRDALPSASPGVWPWDLPWQTGSLITQYVSWRALYCPGTSERFSDADNATLWNYVPNSLRVAGYANTFPGSSVIASNQNASLTPQRLNIGGVYVAAPAAATRVLVADATISMAGQYDFQQVQSYNFTAIPGGAAKPHLSPHLSGKLPEGGNLGMLDGHVEWRDFSLMRCRVSSGSVPGFWW